MKHILLGFTGDDKCHTVRVVDDGEREGDSFRWRLGRVFKIGNPSVGFGEQFMAGEERTGVSVRSHSEQDQVKHGESSGVLFSEQRNKLFLVLVREFIEVVQERFVNGVDLFPWNRDVRKEGVIAGSEVGVLVVEGDHTFITEEDFPDRARNLESVPVLVCVLFGDFGKFCTASIWLDDRSGIASICGRDSSHWSPTMVSPPLSLQNESILTAALLPQLLTPEYAFGFPYLFHACFRLLRPGSDSLPRRNSHSTSSSDLYSPLVPLNTLLTNQSLQVVGKTSTTERQRELSPLLDCILLGLDDKVGERVHELGSIGERVEDGRGGRLRRHCMAGKEVVSGSASSGKTV